MPHAAHEAVAKFSTMGESDKSFEKDRKLGKKRSRDENGERTDHDRKYKKPKRVNDDVRGSSTPKKPQKELKKSPKSEEFAVDSNSENENAQPTLEEVTTVPKEATKKHKTINSGTDKIVRASNTVKMRETSEIPKKEKKKKNAKTSNGNTGPADVEQSAGNSSKPRKKHKLVNGSVHENPQSGAISEVPDETPQQTKSRRDKHQPAEVDSKAELGEDAGESYSKKEKEEKKSKSHRQKVTNGASIPEVPAEAPAEAADDAVEPAIEPKKRKKKHRKEGEDEPEDETNSAIVDDTPILKKKKTKKTREAKKSTSEELAAQLERDNESPDGSPTIAEAAKKERRKKKKERHQVAEALADGDSMDVDVSALKLTNRYGLQLQPLDAPEEPEYPFFSQNMSLWLPLFPIGFDKPVSGMADQHLAPLKNHYSALIGGVLLDYGNVAVGDKPGRPRQGTADNNPTLLTSVDEYAVGYGWLTFTASLFIPSRGAFMEGRLILQSEGHIGVVCWNKFNASIEAKRLPKGWKYIDLAKRAEDAEKSMTAAKVTLQATSGVEDDPFADDESAAVQQMHSTGYWVDAVGRRIKGTLRFRIKGFDVGLAGDNGYLSIEGTMLTLEEERELLAEEIEVERQRKLRLSGNLRREARRVPEFSLTQFGREDEEEDSGKRVEVYQGSRPMTPDD